MTKENWITIGVALFVFMGNLLNTWYKDRLERRKTKGEPEQSRRLAGGIRSLLGNRLISVLLPMISIAIAVTYLISELSRTDAMTRKTMFDIALYTSIIFSQLLLLLICSLSYLTHKKDKLFLDFLRAYGAFHINTMSL